MFVFLFLTYFTLYDWLWVHPNLYRWPNFVPFCGWVIFHCMYVPHLLYAFIYWWTYGHLISNNGARIYNGEKTVSLTSSAGKTGQLHVRMTLEHYLTPYIKINSKWIKDLNLRPDTIKLLEKNTLWHKSQQDPFGSLPRVVKRKTKINKQDLIKLKSFFMAKETRHKMKRQLSEREKTFALTFLTQLCGLLWPRGCKARLYMCLSVGYAPWCFCHHWGEYALSSLLLRPGEMYEADLDPTWSPEPSPAELMLDQFTPRQPTGT